MSAELFSMQGRDGFIGVKFNLNRYRRLVDALANVQTDALEELFFSPACRFVVRSQTYITREIDLSLHENGNIPEGSSKEVRGKLWRGWATWQVKRSRPGYGGTVIEGTRFRMRKTARGSVAAATGRTWSRSERKTQMVREVAQRDYEKVWKKRASGRLHSDSSQLMQDTGRMRAGIFLIDTTINGNVISIRPSQSQVRYFFRQNTLRPMWHLFKPKDTAEIGKYAQDAIAEIPRLIGARIGGSGE